MGHYAAEMLGPYEPVEATPPVGFVVTPDYQVMTAAKAKATLKFLTYLRAPRFPDEPTARKAARVAAMTEIARLEARIVDLKLGLRNRGKRHG